MSEGQWHLEESVSAVAHPHSASVVQVETNRLLPWLMLTCLLSGFAIATAFYAIEMSKLSERASALAREDIRILSAKMGAYGIDVDEHSDEIKRRKK